MKLQADAALELASLHAIIDDPGLALRFNSNYFSTPQAVVMFNVLSKYPNKRFDRAILISTLSETGQMDLIGGTGFIERVLETEYNYDLVDEYITKLKELATKRSTQLDLYRLVDQANVLGIAELSGRLAAINQTLLQSAGVELEDESHVDKLADIEIDAIISSKHQPFIKVGFKEFDRLLGGLEITDLVIVAARTSMGKTSLLLKFLYNMARNRIPVELISFEMSNSQIIHRLLSMESGIPTNRLKQGLIDDEEKTRLVAARNSFNGLPFTLAYTSFGNITDLCNHIRLIVRNKGVKVVGIDYVQLIPMKPGNETQDLYAIARALKALAVELGIVILLVSQLSRGVDARKDHTPMLSDLRQSGGLEENADKVIFIVRDFVYTQDVKDLGIARVVVAKNRNGPLAAFNFMFNEDSTNFYEL